MSEDESEPSGDSAVVEALRTVTPGYSSHRDVEMDVIGWSVFLGLVVLLVPFLPLLIVVWLISKALEKI
ncbi:DUF7535 family protein [Halapricum desulfuricans]|uniref:Uncharacterized protein n=1 Tax=Halapricum desulfuricans TaxID=2841257 RepID=A0A897N4F4_9EURY|nr:hypothetical protein [Halapricum desulfuricans]QSG07108.1 Uncharacterized protein HSR121_2788 [Halapricum desulfuricans]QSG12822.1 Uncharacterized protein HSBGL_2417 [Halapricum desulfuricans]